MSKGTALFLDTSIQIARFVHSEDTKKIINERISRYSITMTGEVVKQEFKRRLLKEAKYLLELVGKHASLEDVYQRVLRLPRQQQPKQKVCLLILGNVFKNASKAECVERFKLYLHYLLTLGLPEFDEGVDHVNRESGCYCSRIPIEEKRRFERYEFGTHLCSKTPPGSCKIVEFVKAKAPEIERILKTLEHIPADKKTSQLQDAENFIKKVLHDPSAAISYDPCYKVGDLLIALESCNATAFYTLNGKESQHLCRVLNQDLIVRRLNPEYPDVECKSSDEKWPEF